MGAADSKDSNSPQGVDVMAELERVRKLMEFVEGVLPPQAADAMRFFKQKSNGGGDSPSENDDSKAPDLAQLALNTVEMQNQRAQIQESADNHAAELKHEFDNLQVVI